MRLRRLIILIVALILVLQASSEPAHSAPLQASTVSITMNNPSCGALPQPGMCLIKIANLIASGSDQSFSRVEVLVNGKLLVYMAGFFESTAYLASQMLPGGMAVACGSSNASGKPDFGRSYLLAANAYMADGTSSSDSMTIYCPAYDAKIFLPVTRK
jgi:hypothetical protein